MKTLYLDCGMGAAGDMLMAALLKLHPDPQGFIRRMNSLQIPGVSVFSEPAVKCGITGLHVSVKVHGIEEESIDADAQGATLGGHDHTHTHEHSHGHSHHHTAFHDIGRLLAGLALPEAVREDALAVYRRIAEAESFVHGTAVDEIHFHEVGNMDAVADIVGVCLLIHELEADLILASPVHVGSGHVHCAHGILPVPAPATARLLQGIPVYSTEIQGELCTPTGAALLAHFCQDFGPMPVMRVSRIGYGMGSKNFPRANCVRALLGETEDDRSQVVELCCNLDDITPEAVGFVTGLLLENGALDVYTVSAQMKKNRPGTLLYCMCQPQKKEEMLRLLFLHTTTLGVREYLCSRYTLARQTEVVSTPYGSVRIKHAEGFGVRRSKPEFDDLARIAAERGISLSQAAELARESIRPAAKTPGD